MDLDVVTAGRSRRTEREKHRACHGQHNRN
jgi:hypothetical protein